MKFNKLHTWMHLGEMIRWMGMVWNYSMQSAEWAHKEYLKKFLRTYFSLSESLRFLHLNALSSAIKTSYFFLSSQCAALTNFKHFLPQICSRIQRREFAIDVIAGGLRPDTQRALLKFDDVQVEDDEAASEFGFTGKVESVFSAQHRLFLKLKNSWDLAVQGVFAVLTGSDVWPPVQVPVGIKSAALLFDPSAVQMYRGLKIVRPGLSNTTLQCSPSFHGRPRYDTVQLNDVPGFAYDDVAEFEYGLVHVFFSYSGDGLLELLKWGAGKFNIGSVADRGQKIFYAPHTQFFLQQRYRPAPADVDALLPLRYYRIKMLSNDFETESVSVIRCRARPFSWFHGVHGDDMRKRKGAIFCQF